MAESVNVLGMVHGEHRFVFIYDDQSIETILETLEQYAADPDLDFSWHDAAVLTQRVQDMVLQQKSESAEGTDEYPHRLRDAA